MTVARAALKSCGHCGALVSLAIDPDGSLVLVQRQVDLEGGNVALWTDIDGQLRARYVDHALGLLRVHTCVPPKRERKGKRAASVSKPTTLATAAARQESADALGMAVDDMIATYDASEEPLPVAFAEHLETLRELRSRPG